MSALTPDTITRIAAVVLDAQAFDPLKLAVAKHYSDAAGFVELARVNAERGDLFAVCRCLVYAGEHREIARVLRRRRWS